MIQVSRLPKALTGGSCGFARNEGTYPSLGYLARSGRFRQAGEQARWHAPLKVSAGSQRGAAGWRGVGPRGSEARRRTGETPPALYAATHGAGASAGRGCAGTGAATETGTSGTLHSRSEALPQDRETRPVGDLQAEAGTEVFTFDTFRVEDGKLVEHWDVAVINPPVPGGAPGGRGQ